MKPYKLSYNNTSKQILMMILSFIRQENPKQTQSVWGESSKLREKINNKNKREKKNNQV